MKWSTIGLEKSKKSFENIITDKRLGHAYLFWGEEMIGKRTFAMELCAMINEDADGHLFDTIVVAPRIADGETKIYIEDVRDLKSFLSLRPIFGKRRIAVIDDADRLTTEATNAILKVLEEPPSSSLIILISSKPKALPKTIYSRCHHVHFANNDQSVMEPYLAGLKLDKADTEFLARLSRGRIGWVDRVMANDQLDAIRDSIGEFEKIMSAGVYEKMIYAKSLAEREDGVDILGNLIYYFSADNFIKVERRGTLAKLLKTYTIMAQPQYNHRLVLENFLLSLH